MYGTKYGGRNSEFRGGVSSATKNVCKVTAKILGPTGGGRNFEVVALLRWS